MYNSGTVGIVYVYYYIHVPVWSGVGESQRRKNQNNARVQFVKVSSELDKVVKTAYRITLICIIKS